MNHYVTAEKDRVPLVQKAAFGAGHLVNNLLPGALGVFMFFLLTAFGMESISWPVCLEDCPGFMMPLQTRSWVSFLTIQNQDLAAEGPIFLLEPF
ncbi:MAG: hypothetical protein U5L72_19465 [Bacteroidales bacterium]|nr:hypothetical protein [Bacteroidales bacterium]